MSSLFRGLGILLGIVCLGVAALYAATGNVGFAVVWSALYIGQVIREGR